MIVPYWNVAFEIVVDGGADLLSGTPEDVLKVPINVFIGEEEYTYPGTISKEDVLSYIREMKPGKVKTSQPSPKQIMSAVEGMEGDVLYITLSSRLSGLYNAALIASNLMKKKGVNLHVFDSLSVSAGIGILVREALRLRDEGKTIEEVIPALEALRSRIRIYFAVPTLDYLVAGGRLDPFKATLAKIVGIRPILTIREGRVDLENTVRKNKLWAEMAALAGSESVLMAYAPGGDDGKALEEHLNYRGIKVEEKVLLSPVIVVHAGPGAVSMLFVE
ncbi:MAG: fatty acid kinase fatty acid binding subunit [Candidatus Diapherotrites archaeon]|nr:fatty acid kinase fatty acid binding subunit [Candidatus Diapherotrites archaeon]MDN5366803.1 fatty acid kinase fatty acid binding subunit [Candidatus Diapherotrites archaeon]